MKTSHPLLYATLALTLSACGGSGGGSDDNGPDNNSDEGNQSSSVASSVSSSGESQSSESTAQSSSINSSSSTTSSSSASSTSAASSESESQSSSLSSSSAISSSSASSSSSTDGGTLDANKLSCEQANQVQGFASLGSGTTGGAGGDEVTVSTGTELSAALSGKGANPLTIFVDGTITPENSSADKFEIKDMNDVSIIGVGDAALFDGIGIKIWRANNVIVRNITVRYVDIGDKDHISIEGPASNIWIDHNEFYNTLDSEKDYYDELVSGKKNVDNVTISYNILRDSWKTSLWGSSDTDNAHRRITFHGNHWLNANSRLPLFRFGEGHIFSNHYEGVISTGINSRMGANIKIDGNVFEDSKNPIGSYFSEEVGYWDLGDNLFDNVEWVAASGGDITAGPNPESTVSYDPPYEYSLVPLEDVRTHVAANAGVGIIVDCLDSPVDGGGSDAGGDTGGGDSGTVDEPANPDQNLATEGADGTSKGGGTSFGDVNDGNLDTFWQPASRTEERVSVKWGSDVTLNTVIVRELGDEAVVWALVDHASGETLASGTGIGAERLIDVGAVTTNKLNLMIESADNAPKIAEFEVYLR